MVEYHIAGSGALAGIGLAARRSPPLLFACLHAGTLCSNNCTCFCPNCMIFPSDLQVPGLSTIGSSCCSVGHLLWLARPPSYPTSRGSHGHSSPTAPGTPPRPSRRSATTASARSALTRTQVQHFWSTWTQSRSVPSVSTQWLRLPLFPDDAQFEMDMWRDGDRNHQQLFCHSFFFLVVAVVYDGKTRREGWRHG